MSRNWRDEGNGIKVTNHFLVAVSVEGAGRQGEREKKREEERKIQRESKRGKVYIEREEESRSHARAGHYTGR